MQHLDNLLFEPLVNYFDKNEITNPKLSIDNGRVIISNKIFNFNTTIRLLVLFICSFFAFKESGLMTIVMIILIFIILHIIWQDFDSINEVIFDCLNNLLIIHPKNRFKPKKQILFEDIEKIDTDYKFGDPAYIRYRVEVYLKDNQRIVLTDFVNETDAKYLSNYLKKIIFR